MPGCFAWFGSALLLAGSVLLIVSSISAPVINHISFLNVNSAGSETTFGAFGFCRNVNADNSGCSSSTIKYAVSGANGALNTWPYDNDNINNLTGALILHPIAAGVAFLAFLVALCSDRLGYLFSSFLAFIAFLIALVAMVIDFALFAILRNRVNDNTNATASFGNAIWITLAAVIVLLLSSFIVCFGCCSSRRSKRSRDMEKPYGDNNGYVGNASLPPPPPNQKWYRRNRY